MIARIIKFYIDRRVMCFIAHRYSLPQGDIMNIPDNFTRQTNIIQINLAQAEIPSVRANNIHPSEAIIIILAPYSCL